MDTTPSDLEFLAEDELLEIIPTTSVTLEVLNGSIAGEIIWSGTGLNRFHQRTSVPAWIAIMLKKRKMCSICCPTWLEHEYLMNVLREEKLHTDKFFTLPRYFLELGKLLLNFAADDVCQASEMFRIRIAIKDIEDCRRDKITRGLRLQSLLERNVTEYSLDTIPLEGLSENELEFTKPFLSLALNAYSELEN